ncbi:AAA family ATPase [Streptomyces sp. DT24]|uniref:AAA family ATPase n=1 Tax=unclassified Streptomyces TaxID=2593676 RepID=UPI0023B97581|nr:AAA family ATPase [Streptomyces sp. AM 4-1-1]WEH36013.1 AAA family ATPase [Streptomyces sp. AM 4-1-1]
MTLRRYATAAGGVHGELPAQQGAPDRETCARTRREAPGSAPDTPGPHAPVVRDLRAAGPGDGPRVLYFGAGDVVVVSGLPGSGKSTLIRRTVDVRAIDSQDVRDRWARTLPRLCPYTLYRPLVRIAHYRALRRALLTGASLVVHDCGHQAWVRRWLARGALRRGRTLHLILLDVTPETARDGQRRRGRGVSGYAFARHRAAVARLLRAAEEGVLPPGCSSAVLLDRAAAGALTGLSFAGPMTPQGPPPAPVPA